MTLAFINAAFAVVWINMLTTPGDLFAFLRPGFEKYVTTKEWVNHLLFGCEKCFAGQWALWTYFFHSGNYSIWTHFSIVVLSIFFAGFLGKFYQRI